MSNFAKALAELNNSIEMYCGYPDFEIPVGVLVDMRDAIEAQQVVAWVHEDDPVMAISALTKAHMLGGDPASAAAALPYSVAAYAAPPASVVPADAWVKLYRRAVDVANGLTNYAEDRPELRDAERKLEAIQREANAMLAAQANGGG